MRLPKSTRKLVIGSIGKEYTAGILLARGYPILARNDRMPFGEIGIVAAMDAQPVLIEVKSRTNRNFGFPVNSITREKQSRMISSAEAYLEANPIACRNDRIDVFAVNCSPDGIMTGYEWFENDIA